MDQDWLEAANAVIDANIHLVDYTAAAKIEVGGSHRMRGTSRPGLSVVDLPAKDRAPFQKMLAHPALVHRLN
ncbi:MAG TPA: hypothetical protein DIT99_22170, partial [Candidatus Latescibacteria bacterium]|nr:hypothetical protein [Candidatus Latescibacterota bacterium]